MGTYGVGDGDVWGWGRGHTGLGTGTHRQPWGRSGVSGVPPSLPTLNSITLTTLTAIPQEICPALANAAALGHSVPDHPLAAQLTAAGLARHKRLRAGLWLMILRVCSNHKGSTILHPERCCRVSAAVGNICRNICRRCGVRGVLSPDICPGVLPCFALVSRGGRLAPGKSRLFHGTARHRGTHGSHRGRRDPAPTCHFDSLAARVQLVNRFLEVRCCDMGSWGRFWLGAAAPCAGSPCCPACANSPTFTALAGKGFSILSHIVYIVSAVAETTQGKKISLILVGDHVLPVNLVRTWS